jgi:Spy/CpxP family protein refolding chaperone
MRCFSLAAAVCTLAVAATPAWGQYGGMGGSMGGGMGGRGMGRAGGTRPVMVTDAQIDGPPTPEMMHQLLSLSDSQLATYAHRYDSLMTETRAERDSAHVAVKTMRDAFTARDRDGARAEAASARALADDLTKRDEAFDRSLKAVLSKEQQKQYDKWKDQNKKEAEEQQREEMRGAGGGRGRRGGMTGGTSGGVPTF